MFFKRKDVIQDMADQAARKMYDRALYKLYCKSRDGDPESSLAMGRYWLGGGPKKDVVNALGYLNQAARAGIAEARILFITTLLQGCNDDTQRFSSWATLLKLETRGILTLHHENYKWIYDEAI